MEIIAVFNDIEKLELKLLELYQYFGNLFSDDPAAADLFTELGNEEKSHSDLIQYQRKIVRKNPKLFENVDVNIKEVRDIISNVDSIINRIQLPELNEAIKIAIDFESNAAEAHYRSAMQQANQEVSDLLKHLGVLDKEHFSKLREFAKSRGFLQSP
jgi:rubrerythrin